MKKLIVCLSSLQHLIDNAIAVQGERRAELARAMLSRSPQSHLTLLSSAKVLHLTCDVNSLEGKSCKNMLIK